MNFRNRLIEFQNEAEREFGERKNVRTTVRFLVAFTSFLLSNIIALARFPILKLQGKTLSGLQNGTVNSVDKSKFPEIVQYECVLLEFGTNW